MQSLLPHAHTSLIVCLIHSTNERFAIMVKTAFATALAQPVMLSHIIVIAGL